MPPRAGSILLSRTLYVLRGSLFSDLSLSFLSFLPLERWESRLSYLTPSPIPVPTRPSLRLSIALYCPFPWLKVMVFPKPLLFLTVMPLSCDPRSLGSPVQAEDTCKARSPGLASPWACYQPLPDVCVVSHPWGPPSCTYSCFGGLACTHLRGVAQRVGAGASCTWRLCLFMGPAPASHCSPWPDCPPAVLPGVG